MSQQSKEDLSGSKSPIMHSQHRYKNDTATAEESSIVDDRKERLIDSKKQDHELYPSRQQKSEEDLDAHQHPSEPPMYNNGQHHFFQQQNESSYCNQHQNHAEYYYGGEPTMTMGPPMYNGIPAYYQQMYVAQYYVPIHVPVPVPVPVAVVHHFVQQQDANSTTYVYPGSSPDRTPTRRRIRKSRSNDKASGPSPTSTSASASSSEGAPDAQRISTCEESVISVLSHSTSSTPANSPRRRRMRGRKNSRQALQLAINEDGSTEEALLDGGLMRDLEKVKLFDCDAVLTGVSRTPGTSISDGATVTL